MASKVVVVKMIAYQAIVFLIDSLALIALKEWQSITNKYI